MDDRKAEREGTHPEPGTQIALEDKPEPPPVALVPSQEEGAVSLVRPPSRSGGGIALPVILGGGLLAALVLWKMVRSK